MRVIVRALDSRRRMIGAAAGASCVRCASAPSPSTNAPSGLRRSWLTMPSIRRWNCAICSRSAAIARSAVTSCSTVTIVAMSPSHVAHAHRRDRDDARGRVAIALHPHLAAEVDRRRAVRHLVDDRGAVDRSTTARARAPRRRRRRCRGRAAASSRTRSTNVSVRVGSNTITPIGRCSSTARSWFLPVRSASKPQRDLDGEPPRTRCTSRSSRCRRRRTAANPPSRVTVTTPWIGSRIGNGRIARLRRPNASMYGW